LKEVVVYYSLTGDTRALAARLADERKADLVEIREQKKRSLFGAFVFGAYQAMKSRPSKIDAMTRDFSSYDHILLASPVWASSVVPAVIAFVHDHLPAGKDVEAVFSSGGGVSGKAGEHLRVLVESKGSRLVSCQDVRAPQKKRKS
jgi:flavodoxin